MRNVSRAAVLLSCLAMPAWAQQVPAVNSMAFAQAPATQIGAATAAAAAQVSTPANVQAAGTDKVVTVPRSMPPPLPTVSANPRLSLKERVGVQVAQRWIGKFQRPRLDPYGVEHFVDGRGQVQVVCAVDHVCDVALSEDERIFLPIAVGDAGGWFVHTSFSRIGGKLRAHILVKPVDSGLRTDIVVQTNKRTLAVSLVSTRSAYMPLVALDRPVDIDSGTAAPMLANAGPLGLGASVKTACDLPPSVPPNQFHISGPNVSWRPTEVFEVETPVGAKTCIREPANIGDVSLPALLALGHDGGWFSRPSQQVVNVRFVDRTFIVDGDVPRFVLIDGVGGSQQVATVKRIGP
jgi:type IV secretion system protein VirB9